MGSLSISYNTKEDWIMNEKCPCCGVEWTEEDLELMANWGEWDCPYCGDN
jgi:uncharacterized Zn-finger protein